MTVQGMIRDLISLLITRRCWRCGQRAGDPGMVTDLGSHLAMHRTDPPGWHPGWVNPVARQKGNKA